MANRKTADTIYEFLMHRKPDKGTEAYRTIYLDIACDIIILVFLTFFFTHSIINFRTDMIPDGSEWDTFAVPDMVLRNSISQFHAIPMWNPYLRAGIPFFADPMAHILNLQAFVPILLFGEINGLKIALVLTFFIAGLGQYFLGYFLGIGRLARLWSAAIFMMCGLLAARFIQGQYNLILSMAWLPFFILSVFAIYKTNSKWPIVLGAVSIAEMWLAGSPYYVMFSVGVIICITLFYSIRKVDTGSIEFNATGIARVIVMCVLGLLLTAVTLLPQMEVAPRLVKVASGMEGAQPFHRAVINFLADDMKFANSELLGKLPVDEEYYAYIGIAPFIFMLFLVWAYKPGHRRDILAIISMLMLMALWVNMSNSPLHWLFEAFPFLNKNFHYPSRALIIGASLIPILGAFGLDELIAHIKDYASNIHLGFAVVTQKEERPDATVVGSTPLIILFVIPVVAFAVMSIWSLYKTNSSLVKLKQEGPLRGQIIDQVKATDNSTFYLNAPYSSAWHQAIISRGIFWSNAWYGWILILSDRNDWTKTIPDLVFTGKYLIHNGDQTPAEPDAVLLKTLLGDVNLFRLQNSPPFAFFYPDAPQEPPTGWQETPATWVSPNEVVIKYNATQPGDIVALVGSYPGWSVNIDDRPAELEDISGYLGVRAVSGDHTYRFSFFSFSFIAGAVISLIGLLIIIIYCIYKRPTFLERP